MYSIDDYLILVWSADKNQELDKTKEIESFDIDEMQSKVHIKYYGNEIIFHYNSCNVKIFTSPEIIDIENKLVLKNGILCYNVVKIQKFSKYARLHYKSKKGYTEVVDFDTITLLNSELKNEKSKDCLEYLKEVAEKVGLCVYIKNKKENKNEDEGIDEDIDIDEDLDIDEDVNKTNSTGGEKFNILKYRYDKIDFVRPDSILACYLRGRINNNRIGKDTNAIFPFGFNASQQKAVYNALNNRLSVIEGPPGTGKTQTILNIIANAVMRGESVAVVSSNNSATANVFDKLKKRNLDFLVASLGNTDNKDNFIEQQSGEIPNLPDWQMDPVELAQSIEKLQQDSTKLGELLCLRNERAVLLEELERLEKEYEHFKATFPKPTDLSKMPVFPSKVKAAQILQCLSEYQLGQDRHASLNFFEKIRWFFIKNFNWQFGYGIKNMRLRGVSSTQVIVYCQHSYYERRLAELQAQKADIEAKLNLPDFKEMDAYTELAQKVFKAKLYNKYQGKSQRTKYKKEELWLRANEFVKDYPVVLSATYSLTSSLGSQFLYDYVIVDEASQVDIATGALVMASAKKAVIVGDLKQLPNVIKPEMKEETSALFKEYNLLPAYSYSENSFLSSVIKLFEGKVPSVLLKEHYRCHPKIIGFCNQRFYNNELIILTEPKTDKKALMVYRTNQGNHARIYPFKSEHTLFNPRQIDVIKKEVIKEQQLNVKDDSLGIVTPYSGQAEALQKEFKDTGVKADTVDKFQGQERSVMIFSTVANKIGYFASNPNRLNVAVSRAIDQFIVVTDGNDNDHTSPIHDLIGYIQYHNYDIIDSKLSSVFDYLYQQYAAERQEVLKKYGKVSNVDSENLMYSVIKEVLNTDEFAKYDVTLHVSLSSMLKDKSLLCPGREFQFATHRNTHVDFLIFSKLTYEPILAIEVDGYTVHANKKQKERDDLKDDILKKYGIPIARFETIGYNEKEKLTQLLQDISNESA